MSKTLPSDEEISAALDAFEARRDEVELFRKQVADFFLTCRQLHDSPLPAVHSVKSRIKDVDHLREKIKRKWDAGPIDAGNFFSRINDAAGVRVLHLHSRQFETIHRATMAHIDQGYWYLLEPPVAYSWDPEATAFFQRLGLHAETRETYYTSIHYVVKPQQRVDLTCEIQVRTLFEEVWGEIDHSLNYPSPTTSLSCKEQLRVLAKLASTGTRLADAIFAIHQNEG
jgi:ppGpp synthetase/RelA/SpoT-type nucleotidyltranferase